MEIKVHENKNYIVIQIFGSLDIYTSLELKSSFDNLDIVKDNSVVLDMSNVNYIDSSGIGTLIKITNTIKGSDARLYITGAKPLIEKVFKVAGLSGYFNMLSNEEFNSKFPI
ncbi:MAG: STAS domain-containing protein [Spirochaetia bacterium]|nr:STAS domain-containing protein [Spirochaetia bacterium]